MKQIFVLIAFFAYATASAQDYTVLHINSSWNFRNDYKDLNKIKGAKIVRALLEEQKQSVKDQIKSVPVIFLYRDRNLIGRWDAGISLSIKVPVQEIQNVIEKSRYTRVATN
tara:strand:+ start:68 stop:403 length:336 start_codon:yes stop_codon:yes gene_type:complete